MQDLAIAEAGLEDIHAGKVAPVDLETLIDSLDD